jgi:hypothetical protein
MYSARPRRHVRDEFVSRGANGLYVRRGRAGYMGGKYVVAGGPDTSGPYMDGRKLCDFSYLYHEFYIFQRMMLVSMYWAYWLPSRLLRIILS